MDRTERCVLVTLGDLTYGVPLRQLVSIEPMAQVVPVPHVPAWLLGVTYRQGRVLSVVDLATVLDPARLPEDEPGQRRLLIAANGDMAVGLAVPGAIEMFNVEAEHILPVPPSPDLPVNRYLSGQVRYGERTFSLLDLERLLSTPSFLLSA